MHIKKRLHHLQKFKGIAANFKNNNTQILQKTSIFCVALVVAEEKKKQHCNGL